MNMAAEMSARRADYTAWTSGTRPERRPLPEGLEIAPCANLDSMSEILGALRKLKHDKNFISKVFESRDKQLFPRDLLVATVPTKKKGGRRPIGVIRRSMLFDKKKRSTDLSIDFVWVLPDYRSCGMGRQLMAAGLISGKPKTVHLQIAGSEANTAALGLYTSLGFVWEEHEENAKEKTEMVLKAELAEQAVANVAAAGKPPLPLPRVSSELAVESGGRVTLRLTTGKPSPPQSKRRAPQDEQQRAVRLSAG